MTSPVVPDPVLGVAAERRLGAFRTSYAAPSWAGVLGRATALLAGGLTCAGLGIWTQLDVVRIFGVVVVVASFIYLVAGLRRTGQSVFVFAGGLVHVTRSGVGGVRWDEVDHLEVVKKRSVESMLGLPSYVLHRRDDTAMRLTGFLVESRELGRHLDQVLPAR